MSHRRYRITHEPDGSTTVTRTGLGFLGGFATGVALVFGIVAIVALFEAQWAAFGICLLLCGIFLPNFAKRHRKMQERSSEAGQSTRHHDPGISHENPGEPDISEGHP